MHAISPDGTEKWTFKTGGPISACAAVGADGTVYFGSADKRIYAVNPDGTEKWHIATGGEVHAAPTIGPDGTLYIGSYDRKVYAIKTSGGPAATGWPMRLGNAAHQSCQSGM